MSFKRPGINTIYERVKADMEARLNSSIAVPRFSLLGIIALVFAGGMHLLYGYLDFIALQLFADTASTEYLDRLANIYGVPRKAATYATGTVTFTGADTTVIPEGTKVQNSDGILYSTIAEVTITLGVAQVDIQSDTEGEAGNTTDAAMVLVFPILGVDTEVTADTLPNGGVNVETDEALRLRLLQRLQNPPSSGTAADYVRWALEVPGVGKAWTLTALEYNGAGTVAVIIATDTLDIVDPAVKTATEEYIESVRPIGANVDVLDVDPITTEYNIDIEPAVTQFEDSITTNLQNLHLAEASPGGTILLSHIQTAIGTSGVDDYKITEITVDNVPIGESNIVTTGVQVAKFTSATFASFP